MKLLENSFAFVPSGKARFEKRDISLSEEAMNLPLTQGLFL